MPEMPIYVVSPIWPTQAEPASGTFVKVCADGLADAGWSVDISAVGLSSRSGKAGKVERYARLCLGQLALTFRRRGIIYVHLPTWFAAFAWVPVLLRRMPVVVNLHGSDIHSRKLGAELAWPLTRRLIRRAKMVVVPSRTFAVMVREQVPSVELEVSASGGYLQSRFHPVDPRPLRAEFGFADEELVCGYVSRIVEGKGWRIFLDAISDLIERGIPARGLMIGAGSDAEALQKEIASRGLRDAVQYVGQVPQDAIKNFLGACDVFLFTSRISRVDTLGLAAIEAIASGLPVVALDTPLMREYVEPGLNGELAREYSGAAFGTAALISRRWASRDAESRQSIAATVASFRTEAVSADLSRKLAAHADRK